MLRFCTPRLSNICRYNTQADRKNDTATPRIVTQCEPALPTWFRNRPATAAAASGSSGIKTKIVFKDISALQVIQFGHIDGLAITEKHHEDGQANSSLRGSDGQDEKDKDLAVQVAEKA